MDEDREVCERRVGTTLRGKWKIERLLGVGGMAAVYEVTHKIGRREAVKILHPEIARSKDLRARFEREAQAVNAFKHPGVVEIRDIDVTDDGAPFLVMELLEGEPLSDMAQRLGGMELGQMLRLVDELLDVLGAAHAQGIIHRDIKLDNLFLLTDGRLKVLDFGIARMRDGVKTAMRTRAGATLGTVSYMAPEQVRGSPIDQRADLFAVGATMFRLVAKRRLHEARTEAELLVKMATMPAPALASAAPDAPQAVCLIIDRALAFDRERRYPDARTMQEDVRAVLRGEAPPWASARLAAGDVPQTGAPGLPLLAGSAGPQDDPAAATAAGLSVLPVERTQDDPAGQAAAATAAVGTEVSLLGAPAAPAAPVEAAVEAAATGSFTVQRTLISPESGPSQVAPVSVRVAHEQAATPSLVGAVSAASALPAPPSMAGPPIAPAGALVQSGPQSAWVPLRTAPRPSSKAPLWIAIGGAALTIAAALGTWWVLRDRGDAASETPPIELPTAATSAPTAPIPVTPAPEQTAKPASPAATPAATSAPKTTKPSQKKPPFELPPIFNKKKK